jgi:hypothetical protein
MQAGDGEKMTLDGLGLEKNTVPGRWEKKVAAFDLFEYEMDWIDDLVKMFLLFLVSNRFR